MTWLEIINRVLLQWLFIRLTRNEIHEIKDFKLKAVNKGYKRYWYSIQGFIIPTTGWNQEPFIFWGDKWMKKITKEHIKQDS